MASDTSLLGAGFGERKESSGQWEEVRDLGSNSNSAFHSLCGPRQLVPRSLCLGFCVTREGLASVIPDGLPTLPC